MLYLNIFALYIKKYEQLELYSKNGPATRAENFVGFNHKKSSVFVGFTPPKPIKALMFFRRFDRFSMLFKSKKRRYLPLWKSCKMNSRCQDWNLQPQDYCQPSGPLHQLSLKFTALPLYLNQFRTDDNEKYDDSRLD